VTSRAALIGAAILPLIVLVAATAPIAFPASPFRQVGRPFLAPFGEHLFGTDQLGRDVAAGVAHGARTSLMIGVLATAVAVLLGTLVGGCAGYYGGSTDDVLMRSTEFFQTIPTFLRSEEHTSELQSLRHLVCRLLLEKKKRGGPVPTPAEAAAKRPVIE